MAVTVKSTLSAKWPRLLSQHFCKVAVTVNSTRSAKWPWLISQQFLHSGRDCSVNNFCKVDRDRGAIQKAMLPGDLGHNKAVKARFWPWLDPFFRLKSLKLFQVFLPRSTAVRCSRWMLRIEPEKIQIILLSFSNEERPHRWTLPDIQSAPRGPHASHSRPLLPAPPLRTLQSRARV